HSTVHPGVGTLPCHKSVILRRPGKASGRAKRPGLPTVPQRSLPAKESSFLFCGSNRSTLCTARVRPHPKTWRIALPGTEQIVGGFPVLSSDPKDSLQGLSPSLNPDPPPRHSPGFAGSVNLSGKDFQGTQTIQSPTNRCSVCRQAVPVECFVSRMMALVPADVPSRSTQSAGTDAALFRPDSILAGAGSS